MKRAFLILLCAAMLPWLGVAQAESAKLVIVLEPGPAGVVLMDEYGNSVSAVQGSVTSGGKVYWTLAVNNNGGADVTLYTRDGAGNWVNTGVTYDMVAIFGTPVPSDPTTPPPTATPTQAVLQPWPVFDELTLYGVTIKPLEGEKRVQSRCGPSKEYHGAGGYKPYKVTSTAALFAEGGYMLVDMYYTTVGHRRVYFPISAFTGTKNVPEASLTGYTAYTVSDLTPVFGPGGDYDVFTEAVIASGTRLAVYLEENGWVFAEFACALGNVRAWVPAAQVRW
jgi:hypothetical protein